MQQNTIHCTHYFSTFQIFVAFFICGAFFPHDNLSCGEFLDLTICHVDKFLHMTIFSPRAPPVVPVTNMRYGCAVPVLGVRGFIAAAEACGTLYPLSSLLFPIYLKVRFKSLVHFSTMLLPGGSMWKNKVFDRIVLK